MSKRAFIIHGWGGNPEEGWFPWLKQQLIHKGYKVFVPAMPETDNPTITAWVEKMIEIIGKPNEETTLIGHSIGCQTILRYLENLPIGEKINQAIFVAGWLHLKGLEENEVPVAKPWLNTPINFEKIKTHCQRFVAIFSDDDYYVPLEDAQEFEEKLGAKIIIEHNKKHFSGSDGVVELPIILKYF